MPRPTRLAVLAASIGILAGPSAAQHDDSVATASLTRNVGLHAEGPDLVGGGPGYTVKFGPSEVAFVPAFGAAAPRTMPVTFRLESVRRGQGRQRWTAASAVRSYEGTTVRYRRPGYVERYDLRRDGLKQSFVFEELPAGSGDLVVRLHCDTELAATVTDDASKPLHFELEGVGAVTCGEVVGIDADGRRLRGTVRWESGALELILPEHFVASAKLPLELDPLIGTNVQLGLSGNDYVTPDVAYDATNDVYFVVWALRNSANDHDIRGHLVDSTGTPVGATIFVASGTTNDLAPRVANVNSQDAFVVVWARAQAGPRTPAKVRGRAVAAATGRAGVSVDLVAGLDNHIHPDIGGERNVNFDNAILVWENATDDRVKLRRVNVNGRSISVVGRDQDVGVPSSGWNNKAPTICKGGGTAGRFLVAWEREYAPLNLSKIVGAIINRDLGVADTDLQISGLPLSSYDDTDPAVDGEGQHWVVAWERSEAPNGTGSHHDILCRAVRYSRQLPFGSAGYFGSANVVVAGQRGNDERNPTVAWLDGSALVGYQYQTVGYTGAVQSINNFTCADCEPRFTFTANGDQEVNLAIASQRSGRGFGDPPDCLVAVQSIDRTGDNDILIRRFRSDDGGTTRLNGVCGSPGSVYASCARIGHSDFEFTLRNSLANNSVWSVLSLDRIDYSCSGTCRLVPDPYSGWLFSRTTDTKGDAKVEIPIPNSTHMTQLRLYQQWLILDTASPACFAFQADFSRPLQIDIH